MTLVKRNSNQLPTFPRLFDDFFTKDLFDWEFNNFSSSNSSLPSVNIIENNDAFGVELAAPGMDKKDFKIELENDVLKISVEKEMQNEVEDDTRFVRREYNYQSFQRTFHLPKKVVDDSKIVANYEDGILKVFIPKKEEAKPLPPRTIEIN